VSKQAAWNPYLSFRRVLVKQRSISFELLCLCALFGFALPALAEPPGNPPPIEVYFSPKGGCTEAVVRFGIEAGDRFLIRVIRVIRGQT